MTQQDVTAQDVTAQDVTAPDVTAPDVTALARSGIEAFNASDWQTSRALLGPGFVYDETGTGRHIEDVDGVIAVFQAWKAAFPDGEGEVTRIVTEGDTTAVEVHWHGTHSGPLDIGTAVLPPSGRSIDMWSTMWGRWEDGRLLEERHHVDVLTMLAQLGALPAPAQA